MSLTRLQFSILIFSLLLCSLPRPSFSQANSKVVTTDVENFWVAYDSIVSTTDEQQQLKYIRDLYINKGSEGLVAFLRNKEAMDQEWIKAIKNDRVFWDTMRGKMKMIENISLQLNNSIERLRTIYPQLKEAKTYFLVGIRQQGGTIRNNLSLIGTEVALSDPLAIEGELIRLCLHEYIHTQQQKPDFRSIDVLTSSIREGACDFIAELVLQKQIVADYYNYGVKNEVTLWRAFRQDMLTRANNYWVSTGDNPVLPVRDPGYFIGYTICKSYYDKSISKKEATKEIIELDYTNHDKVISFLKESEYEKELLTKDMNSNKLLPITGYTSYENYITFNFTVSDSIVLSDSNSNYSRLRTIDTKSISVAGKFNNLNNRENSFSLTENRKGHFSLKLQKNKLGSKGKRIQFRFVVNDSYIVEPIFFSRNRMVGDDQVIYYFVEL